jgi:hypothetical protein
VLAYSDSIEKQRQPFELRYPNNFQQQTYSFVSRLYNTQKKNALVSGAFQLGGWRLVVFLGSFLVHSLYCCYCTTGMRVKAVSAMPLLPQGLHVRSRILKFGKDNSFFSSPEKNSKQNIKDFQYKYLKKRGEIIKKF